MPWERPRPAAIPGKGINHYGKMTATRCIGVARELKILYKKYTKILKTIEPAGRFVAKGVAAFLQ